MLIQARSTLDEVIADVEQHKQKQVMIGRFPGNLIPSSSSVAVSTAHANNPVLKQESESFNKVLAEIRDIHLGKGRDEQDFSLNERDAVLVDRERRNQVIFTPVLSIQHATFQNAGCFTCS
jgi:hypothetical protein